MIYVKAGDYKGTYLTVWSITEENGYVKGRVGSSSKKQDDTYENSNWFVSFGKNCKDKALTLQEKDRIFMKDFSIKNVYNKETEKAYFNFNIYSFDILDKDASANNTTTTPTKFPKGEAPVKKFVAIEEEEDDNVLPFTL